MPRRNVRKIYVVDGYYHVYNRGVNKSDIFIDRADYSVFTRYLKEYLLPPDHDDLLLLQEIAPRRKPVNCYDDVELVSYCLMPNHYHLFIKQKTKNGLTKFMRALATNYSMYFNYKHARVGPLYESRYKAAMVRNEKYFLHLSRYLHRNPLDISPKSENELRFIREYPFSSYKYYLMKRSPEWLNIWPVLSLFDTRDSVSYVGKTNSYQSFVEEYVQNDRDVLGELSLD